MLHKYGIQYHTDKAYVHNFCNTYQKLLPVNVKRLWEIGVLDGASLKMWQSYYPFAEVIGFDIEDKSSLALPAEIKTHILDQGNRRDLAILSQNRDVDIIVDDGSHIIEHQIMSFEMLFNSLTPGGHYIIEDLHTSTNQWHGYGLHDDKGALQYLEAIAAGNMPEGFPGQTKTADVIKNIDQIIIVSNCFSANKRSITSIIKHK